MPHKTTLPLLLCAVLVLSGCATDSNSPATSSAASAVKPANTPAGSGEGSSFERAVVIQATNEGDGVKAEYTWIRANISGGRPAGQSLQPHGNKVYDVVRVQLPDGSTRTVYFDITNFFGKF